MDGTGERLRIDVQVDPAEGAIHGEIREPGKAGRPFSGWLELLQALELWRGKSLRRKRAAP